MTVLDYNEYINKISPKSWSTFKFSDIFTFGLGMGIARDQLEDLGYPCLHYGDIHCMQERKIDFEYNNIEIFKKYDGKIKPQSLIKSGDLILVDASEDREGTTKSLLIKNFADEKFIAGLHTIIISTKSSEIDDAYKEYITEIDYVKKQIMKYSQGTKVFGINTNNLGKVKISLPSIKEQVKISEIINVLDEKIELKKKYYSNLTIYKRNISEKLIYENNSIDKLSIQEMIDNKILKKITGNLLGKFDGEKKYLSTSSIESTKIIKEEAVVTYSSKPSRAQLKPIENSVWFAKMSNTVKVIKADKDLEKNYILSTGFYGFICNEGIINSDYFFQVFLTKSFNRQKDRFSEGSSQVALKDNILSDIFVPLYSVDEQKKISNLLKSFDLKLKLLDDELKLLEKQKKGLMQQLLTGLIRVNVDEQ